ncbi:hypothetical protein ACLB2K_003951 [Fragaria x ananassa]
METYSEGEEDEEREETGSEEEDDEEDEAHDDDMDEDEAPSSKTSSVKELYRHFSNDHLDSTNSGGLDFRFPISITIKKNDSFLVLREKQRGTLFVLHNCIEILGNVVAVSCIQPSFVDDFNYELLVTNEGSSLMFRSVTTSTPSLQVVSGSPSRIFLLIPCQFFTCGRVNIDVTIWRKC